MVDTSTADTVRALTARITDLRGELSGTRADIRSDLAGIRADIRDLTSKVVEIDTRLDRLERR